MTRPLPPAGLLALVVTLALPTRTAKLAQGVVLVAVLARHGLSVAEIVGVFTAATVAATVLAGPVLALLWRFERTTVTRLGLLAVSGAALPPLTAVALSATGPVPAAGALAALRLATVVYRTNRGLSFVELAGAVRTVQYSWVAGVALTAVGQIARGFALVRTLTADPPTTALVIAVGASVAVAFVGCAAGALLGAGHATSPAHRPGALIRTRILRPGWWRAAAPLLLLLVPACFTGGYLQAVVGPTLVVAHPDSPVQLALLAVVTAAIAAAWAVMLLRQRLPLRLPAWSGLAGVIAAAALLAVWPEPMLVAAALGLAAAVSITLAVQICSGIAARSPRRPPAAARRSQRTALDQAAAVHHVEEAAEDQVAAATVTGLGLVCAVAIATGMLTAAVTGARPAVTTGVLSLYALFTVVAGRPPPVTVKTRRLLRIWLRQTRYLLSTHPGIDPGRTDGSIGVWILGIARQVTRHAGPDIRRSSAPKVHPATPDAPP